MRRVVLPPAKTGGPDQPGGWWHETGEEQRIICDLCPRECSLKPGDRGFCFVRQNVDGEMRLTTYGRSTGFCIDPIEKKPLSHFYPGTSVLSFGTAGCNLGCKFCQNWDISKSREVERLSELALPEMIAEAARQTNCRSVAFTYNDPIVWAEYAMDTARACRAQGIKTVAVTAGYISPEARPAFFHDMDAANVDLKAFTEDFYQKITYSHLQPVLDTLRWLKHESDVWFEITNLVIPDANDSGDQIQQMCDWILNHVGADVPLHFTAFHPDFRMTDRPATPHDTLLRAREIARRCGLHYVYVGNVHDITHQSTWCPACGVMLIERDWHRLGAYNMKGCHCGQCGYLIAGHFDEQPGTWGARRQPIRISDYAVPAVRHAERELNPTRDAVRTAVRKSVHEQELPSLKTDQESAIHRAACEIVAATVYRSRVQLSDPTLRNAAGETVMGAFVTLKRQGQLRGCCGAVGQPMPILPALSQSGMRTAAEDHRFPPVSTTELPFLTLDVTLLSHFEPITQQGTDRVRAVEVGRHGLKIQHAGRAGLLLPSVATEYGWDARTFLDQVCRKAGLPTTAWQEPDAQLFRFEGRLIAGDMDDTVLEPYRSQSRAVRESTDAKVLAAFARSNLIALLQGAVPGCFPASCPDGTVDGLTLQLSFGDSAQQLTFSRIQLRGGLPLQTTLLQIVETAANWLQTRNVGRRTLQELTVDVALLTDPAMHGYVAASDLRGIDPACRAVLVSEAQKMAWHYQQDATADDLMRQAAVAARVSVPAQASVYSFAARTSCPVMTHASYPEPQRGAAIRPAALAGRFYPKDAAALADVVTQCLGEVPSVREDWPAVMVPHAGLSYSGRIAGGVLKRLRFPDRIIVIGPKHTPAGANWAVAPHATWQIPGGEVPADPELARLLAARIPGLEPDADAHAQEHCIEVELPLLARLAPASRITGLAIGSGSLEQCLKFGQHLADVISGMPTPPLLVISSDMNHFASESENRRLDELALQAMETLNPTQLYQTVRSHSISMCGVLPAVIVMETLLRLNRLSQAMRAGYSTSATVTGDTSRVVGYAGMLLG